MFDALYGDLNGHNIYDSDYLGQCENDDEEQEYHKMSKEEKEEPAPKILEGEIKRETDKAILFKFGESENWLPKSQTKIKKKKEGCCVEIPDWLWKKMNEITEE